MEEFPHAKSKYSIGSSTVILHFVDSWSHITFNWLLTNYFINFYNAPLFLSTVYVNGTLQIIIIIIIIIQMNTQP